ncbi:TetR/AcrR family transcriptional regulator [Ferviditalea candida]|uniref:WHG domain-containing protein n=1 Tax=Ferviditalea candida TaxID=3108399 RepID=A0ABU5ZK79_9BACL|nr:WHG domain-containing protein [Paenibacillaceae bacterium T2]
MARAGLDQQIVLLAAAEIADVQGLDEVTLATLAQKLGVRTPSLYNHVSGLPGIRKQLSIYGMNRLTDTLARAAAGQTKDDAVRSLARAYLGFVREHPGLYEATHRLPDLEDEQVKAAAEGTVNVVLGVLQGYGLEGAAAIHTIRGLRSLLHGFASIEQQGGFGMPLDLDTSFRLLIDTFLAGIHSLYAKI